MAAGAGPTWAEALDDWQALLDDVEAALRDGAWEDRADVAPWAPPGDISDDLDADGERRALALADRAGRLREQLEAAMRATSADMGGERRKAAGVTAYRRQQRRR